MAGLVSTHSRPKAAAIDVPSGGLAREVSTHSRPKAAALGLIDELLTKLVSTHSRPKAAAIAMVWILSAMVCFNTQPPEGGCALFHQG